MDEKDRFKAIARKAYLSYHGDGIVDLIIGACTIGFGIDMLVEGSYLAPIILLPFVLYMPLKNRITVPRFGFVEFGTDAKRKKMLSISLAGGLLLLLFLVGAFLFSDVGKMKPDIRETLSHSHMFLIGGLWIVGFLGSAAISGIRRLYAYALLSILIVYGGVFLMIYPPYTMIALGAVISLNASYLLMRFLRTYPLPAEEGAP